MAPLFQIGSLKVGGFKAQDLRNRGRFEARFMKEAVFRARLKRE
jgi:hypothetical protein